MDLSDDDRERLHKERIASTRQKLYDEVWSDPVRTVAERYGLSDVGLAKICHNLEIPLPGRGYWAKKLAGKALPAKAKLPAPRKPGEFDWYCMRLDDVARRADRQREKDDLERARARVLNIEAPAVLSDPHELVERAAVRLRRKTGWTDVKGLRSASSQVLDIAVTEHQLDRALLIFDTVIKNLALYSVAVRVDPARSETIAVVQGTSIRLSLNEHVRQVKHEITAEEQRQIDRESRRGGPNFGWMKLPRHDHKATGVLTLTVGSSPSRSWKDTPRSPLQYRLSEAVVGILALAEEIRRRDEQRNREEEERRRAWAQYESVMRLRKNEAARLRELRRDSANWAHAERIRSYVDAVESRARTVGGLDVATADWIAWARLQANRIDPLVQVMDMVLDAPEPARPGYWPAMVIPSRTEPPA